MSRTLITTLTISILMALPAMAQSKHVHFRKDVLPILKERCFNCHSDVSESPKADLRLDRADELGDYASGGDVENSYLFELIARGENDTERMPPANSGPRLSEQQIATIREWIESGAQLGDWKQEPNWRGAASKRTRRPEHDDAAATTRIDEIVRSQAALKKVEFGEPLSDELFVRRVYLDLAGRIPSIAEAKEFYTKPAESRRDFLIERLIGSEAYASHWYNIWLDALRVQSKFDSARKADLYMWWIRQAVRDNMPYDDFVRELLSAEGYIWENPATGYYYRDQSNRLANVEATASLFLGTDIGCAQCHDDPFDVWTRRDYHEFAAFFHSSTYFFPREQTFANLSWEEIEGQRNAMRKDAQRRRLKWNAYEHDVSTTSYVMNQQLLTRVIHPKHFNPRLPHDYQYDDGKPKENIKPTTLFGSNATFENHHDGMRALAGWVTAPENPRFTLTIVNRIWAQLFGTPLAGPVGDVSPMHSGPQAELVEHLVQTMVDVDYDLQRFISILVHTETYQQRAYRVSAIVGHTDAVRGPRLRRMSAEQLWDSLLTLIDSEPEKRFDHSRPDYSTLHRLQQAKSDAEYWQIIKEMIENGEGYMAKFGTSQRQKHESRATGLLREQLLRASELPSPAPDGHFLRQFGQSDREVIDNAWDNPTTPQAMTLMNGPLFDLLIAPESALTQRLKGKIGKKLSPRSGWPPCPVDLTQRKSRCLKTSYVM